MGYKDVSGRRKALVRARRALNRSAYAIEGLEARTLLNGQTVMPPAPPGIIFEVSSSIKYQYWNGGISPVVTVLNPQNPDQGPAPELNWSSGEQHYQDTIRSFSSSTQFSAQSGPNAATFDLTSNLTASLTVPPNGGAFGEFTGESTHVAVYVLAPANSVFTLSTYVSGSLTGLDTRDGSMPKPGFTSPLSSGGISGTETFEETTTGNSIQYRGQTYYELGSKSTAYENSGLEADIGYSQILYVVPFQYTLSGQYTMNVIVTRKPSTARVTVDSVSTPDSKKLNISYTVQGNDSGQGFLLDVLRSMSPTPDSGGVSIGGNDGAHFYLDGDLATTGSHNIEIDPYGSGNTFVFNQANALRPDLKYKYVLVEADTNGALNPGDIAAPPLASFRIWVVGAIAHGYDFSAVASYVDKFGIGFISAPSDFEINQMAIQLVQDGYDSVVLEHWETASVTGRPGLALAAGDELADHILTKAAGLPGLKPNDVIDVNFIGHSRGTVVISEALQQLIPYVGNERQILPQLLHGFMTETFVDPHPADLSDVYQSTHPSVPYIPTGSLSPPIPPLTLQEYLEKAIETSISSLQYFYAAAQDPNPWIPSNVQAAVDLYQQTPWSELTVFVRSFNPFGEGVQNLWGIDPQLILSSGAPLIAINETQPGIGHHEIFYKLFAGLIQADDSLTIYGFSPFSSDPLAFTASPPSKITAGVPFNVTVTAQNADGTTNTTFSGPITLADTLGNSLSGTLTANAVKGVAAFTGLKETKATSSTSLTASASGLASIVSTTFQVASAAATHLAVSTADSDYSPFALTVSAVDGFGNVDPTYTGNVTISLAANSFGGALGGTLTRQAIGGVATFSNITISKIGANYKINAQGANSLSGSSAAFDIVDQLVITSQPPASVQLGVPFTMVVKAEDGAGNVDSSFSDLITVSGFDNEPSPAGTDTVRAVNGIAIFTNLIEDADVNTSQVLFASDTSTLSYPLWATEAVSDWFDVNPGPAASLQISTIGSSGIAAAPLALTVTALDQYGNPATSFNGNITLSLGGPTNGATLNGTTTRVASNGVASFDGVSISKLASGYTIVAQAAGLPTATSNTFQYGDQAVVSVAPPASVPVGSPFGFAIALQSSPGVVDGGYSGTLTVSLKSSSGPTLGGNLTATAANGMATFSGLTLSSRGTAMIAVSGPGVVGVSLPITAGVPAATQFTLSTPASPAHSPFTLTVSAVDGFGNLDPTYTGSVTISLAANSFGGVLGGTLTRQASAGIATFSNVTINKIGAGYVINAQGTGSLSGSSAPFNIVDQLVVTSQPPSPVQLGVPFTMVVKAEDGAGNVDTSFQDQITAFSGYIGALPLAGTDTVQAVNGVATFTNLVETTNLNSSQVLGVYDSASLYYPLWATQTFSNAFYVNPGPAASIQISTIGSAGVTSLPFSVNVTALDQYGNVATGFNGNVTLSLGGATNGATLNGTTGLSAAYGVASFSGLSISKPGSGYTITASSPGLPSVTSNTFQVADQAVVSTAPPTPIPAGSPFGFAIALQSLPGVIDTTYSGTLTLSLTSTSGPALGGNLTATVANGIATFSGLTLSTMGTATIAVSGPGVAGVNVPVTASAPAATTFAFSGPADGSNDPIASPFSLDVEAVNSMGTVDITYNGMVTLSLHNNPNGATLGGTLSVQASNGIAHFSNLTLDKIGDGYTVSASASGLLMAVSTPFDTGEIGQVSAFPPSIAGPSDTFGLSVSALNNQGGVDQSYSGPVTLSLLDLVSGLTSAVNGTLTVKASGGVASFSGLSIAKPGLYAIQMHGPNLVPTMALITISSPATHLVLTVPPPTSIAAGTIFEVDVTAEDDQGNLDLSYSGPVTLTLSGGGGVLAGNTTATAVNGQVTFPGLSIGSPSNTYSISATSGPLSSVTPTTFDVTAAGVANQLKIISAPSSSVAAESPLAVVVEAVDSFGTVDSQFDGPITLSLLGDGKTILDGIVTAQAVQGVATFSGLSIDNANSDDMIAASAPNLSPTTTASFVVTAAPTSQLEFSSQITDVLANSPFTIVVNADDAYGRITPAFHGPITLSLHNTNGATLGGVLTAMAINGVATFSGLTLSAPGGGFTIEASTSGVQSTVSPPISVEREALVITSAPPATIAAGTGFGLQVVAEDATGKIDTSFSGLVTVVPADILNGNDESLGGTLTARAVNGIATFTNLTFSPVGGDELVLSTNGLMTANTDFIRVVGGAAIKLGILAQPNATTVGTPFTVSIAAEDAAGNVDTSYNGAIKVNLASNPTGATLNGTLTETAANGIATFADLSFNKAGVGYSISANALNLLSASVSAISAVPSGIATQLVVTSQPEVPLIAGNDFTIVVAAEDGAGNVDSTYTGTVTLSTISGTSLGGVLTVQAVHGVATFDGLKIDQASYDVAVLCKASGLASSTSGTFDVIPAAAARIAIQPLISNVLVNAPFEVDVTAEDAFGNVASNYDGIITIALDASPSGALLGGNRTVSAVNGLARFQGLTLSKAGTNYTLSATASGLSSVASDPFDCNADELAITIAPPRATMSASTFGLSVAAETSSGNIDQAFNGIITVSLISYGGNQPQLQGSLTTTAVNGVGSFTGLSLDDAGLYALDVTASNVGGGTTNLLNIVGSVVSPTVTASSFNLNAVVPSMALQFSTNVSASLSAGDMVLQNLTNSTTVPSGAIQLSYNAVTNIATFTFPGYVGGILPDGDYQLTLPAANVTDASGTPLNADDVFSFFVLTGDVNHDGRVDVSDLQALASNWLGTGKTFAQGDLNHDGVVNTADLSILSTNWGRSLTNNTTPTITAANFIYQSSPNQLVFAFDENVSGSLSASSLNVINTTSGSPVAVSGYSYNSTTNTATFSLSASLADGTYGATFQTGSFTDALGHGLASTYTLNFFVLAGDANHDGVVNVADLLALASNWLGTGKTYAQGDFNHDGVVNAADLHILSANWNKTASGATVGAQQMSALLAQLALPAPVSPPAVIPSPVAVVSLTPAPRKAPISAAAPAATAATVPTAVSVASVILEPNAAMALPSPAINVPHQPVPLSQQPAKAAQPLTGIPAALAVAKSATSVKKTQQVTPPLARSEARASVDSAILPAPVPLVSNSRIIPTLVPIVAPTPPSTPFATRQQFLSLGDIALNVDYDPWDASALIRRLRGTLAIRFKNFSGDGDRI